MEHERPACAGGSRDESAGNLQEPGGHACCAPTAHPAAPGSCPACGTAGRPVTPITLRSLLQPHRRPEVREAPYRFCASPDCAVVYFGPDGSQTFSKADLIVRVGLKERSAPRPLCYCFGHSAESLREEWTRTGKAMAADSIRAALKAGGCRCEVTNPSGGCCLGDVVKEVKACIPAAQAATLPPTPAQACCPPTHHIAEPGAARD